MARLTTLLHALNRGEVSQLALARVDQEHLRLAAEVMVNWVPTVLGPMRLRPGLRHLGEVKDSAPARLVPFVFARDDTALVELTDELMRVWIDGALLARPAVSTAITNGSFGSDLTGWTDADELGGTSAWVTGGYMGLTGNDFHSAIRTQEVTVAGGDQGVLHALRVVVARGPVLLRVGSTSQGEDYVTETALEDGVHSIAFTPSGNFHITLKGKLKRVALVASIAVEAAGIVTLPTPWTEGQLAALKWAQSGDVLFVAHRSVQPRRIERRPNGSWSLAAYKTSVGPTRTIDTRGITITPSARDGNITLTASKALFKPDDVGTVWHLRSQSRQEVSHTFTGDNQETPVARIMGYGDSKNFNITTTDLTGTGSVIRPEVSEDGVNFRTVSAGVITSSGSTSLGGEDGVVQYRRLSMRGGDYSSGSPTGTLSWNGGSIRGVVRITGYTSPTEVSAEVVSPLGHAAATRLWDPPAWSGARGWPSAVAFHDGRLWWAAADTIFGSASDNFSNYDVEAEGDSAAIIRNLATGPVESASWLLSMQRLIVGNASQEISIRSSSFDEPLTPTQFTARTFSQRGSSPLQAEPMNASAVFVQQNGRKLCEILWQVEQNDYATKDLSRLNPEITGAGVVDLAVQREPDPHIHVVRSDGQVALLAYEPAEGVAAWWRLVTDGAAGKVENVAVLPGAGDDEVYYVVNRTIGGQIKRYLERLTGQADLALADSHVVYTGAATDTISGLDHLEGETVVAWGDGRDLGEFDVDSGEITLPEEVTAAVVGLPYRARWKSAKLAYAAQQGTAVSQRKRIDHIGLILQDTHHQGVRFGPDFDSLDELPAVEEGAEVAAGTIYDHYDETLAEFPGGWDTDSRLCLEAAAPRPATVSAVAISIATNDR